MTNGFRNSMSNAIELLQTRRSVAPRHLAPPGPNEGQLREILTIAARVPDHGRLVPWRFIVIGPEAGRRLGETIEQVYAADHPDAPAERLALERGRLTRAPLVIAVVSRARPHDKIPEFEQILSAGAACMALVLAANALGFSTNWITEWYAFDRRVLSALHLAEDENIAGFVHIGTATEPPSERVRPDLDEIVTRLE